MRTNLKLGVFDVMPITKEWRGEKICTVLINNPGLILWLHERRILIFDDEVLRQAEENNAAKDS